MATTSEVDSTDALRGLLDLAKVALRAGDKLPADEATELLYRLLGIIERSMPLDLLAQDIRVMRARQALDGMRQ